MHDSKHSAATCDGEAISYDEYFFNDVCDGLNNEQKSLPCKYLYDERGSKLFDRICELDEYYPTRTETQIFQENAAAIGRCIASDVVIVEYGSGSSIKTRLLLDHLDTPKAYAPIDISEDHLLETARALTAEYPQLDVQPIVADFTRDFDLPETFDTDPKCVYFPGSTIGNFERAEAIELLDNIAWHCQPGGGLLIGFDLQKQTDVLERAYNDALGVTAEFNLNLLTRINRELNADFDVEQFEHIAFYNADLGRIEIYLESQRDQLVTIGDATFHFQAGERIHTENSHKYTVEGFTKMALQAGLHANGLWTDEQRYFAIMHFTVS